MLAVWYPLELLKGPTGPTDMYFIILVTVLFFEAIVHIRKR